MWLILATGYSLIILNSNHSIWTLISLEMMNLGILMILSWFLPAIWFLYILSFQVCESIILMAFLLMELNNWNQFYEA